MFLITLVLLLFIQCKKEISFEKKVSNSNSFDLKELAYNPKPSKKSAEIEDKINQFLLKLRTLRESNGLETRNSNDMSLDDLLWNTEALLNMKYADSNKPFRDVISKENNVLIPINDGDVVKSADILAAVESIRRKVGEQWESSILTTKHVVGIDLSITESNTSNLGRSANLTVKTTIGGGGSPVPASNEPFSESESFYFAPPYRNCEQTIFGKDATAELTEKVNARYPTLAKYRGYFVSGTVTFESAHELYDLSKVANESFNNMRDSKLFISDERYANFSLCISGSDMNWYYHNLFDIIRKKSAVLESEFMSIEVKWDGHAHIEPSTGVNHGSYFHKAKILYGVYVLAGCQRVCTPCVDPQIGYCFYTPCDF
jgi:hypothetical protein